MSNSRWDRLIDGLIRYRWALLLLALGLTALSLLPASRVKFDQSIESLYSPTNPQLLEYRRSKAYFGGDDYVFVTYTDPELFQPAGQQRLAELAARVAAVRGIVEGSVQSLDVYLEMTENRVFRSRRQKLLEFSRGALLGDDNQTTAVVCRLVPQNSGIRPRAETIKELRVVAAGNSLKTYVVGGPTLVYDVFRYSKEDGEFMGWAASLLLILVVLFFLRDVRSILLPFVVVQITIIWTRAALWMVGLELSMVSSILAALLTIVGVSTVVYLSFYFQEMRQHYGRIDAFRSMMRVIGVDIVWVCLTTAAGFAAHLSSSIHPVRSFGVTMVIGALLVMLAMALVLPAGMLYGQSQTPPRTARGQQQVNQSLHQMTDWVLAHPRIIGGTTLLILLLTAIGLSRLRLETDFSKNFRANSDVVQSLSFLEDRLGGAGMFEVNFPAPPELDEDHLEKVRRLTHRLRDLQKVEKGLTKVVSITDGLEFIPRIPLLIPNDEAKLRWMNSLQPEFSPSMYNPSKGCMRIMLRARERQTAEDKERLIRTVGQLAREEFPDARVTGLFVLLAHLVESLLEDQWSGLAVAAVALIGIMTLAYRSLWMGLISLVPNILPIIILLGVMGWVGIPMNIGTTMISSDTMGLTIHDSIFYLSAYRRARLSGLDFYGALSEVQTEVRRPLIYSNLALVVGFLVLTRSHFVPLIYFGALVSTAIAGGLLVNLLLIPLLLKWYEQTKGGDVSQTP